MFGRFPWGKWTIRPRQNNNLQRVATRGNSGRWPSDNGWKPCTHVVHINIAEIYGCLFPFWHAIHRAWSTAVWGISINMATPIAGWFIIDNPIQNYSNGWLYRELNLDDLTCLTNIIFSGGFCWIFGGASSSPVVTMCLLMALRTWKNGGGTLW